MSKRLYIQFYNADGGDSLTLPINPESIDLTTEKDIQKHVILNYGEVAVAGYQKLQEITLSSLLPDTTSYFALLASLVETLKHKPYTKEKSIKLLEDWASSQKPIRIIIAGDAYEDINKEFLVQYAKKNIRESTRDIKSEVVLVEYRNPAKQENTYNTDLKTISKKIVKLMPRPIRKYIPANMTAQQGATLYKIAKLVYGEASSRSEKLGKLNGIFDRNKDIAGQIIDMLPLDEEKTVNKL